MLHPRSQQQAEFPHEPVGVAEPQVRPHGECRLRQVRQHDRAGQLAADLDCSTSVRRTTATRVARRAPRTRACGLDKPYADPTGFPLHDYNSFAPGSVMQFIDAGRRAAHDGQPRRELAPASPGCRTRARSASTSRSSTRTTSAGSTSVRNSGATSRIGNVSDNKQNFRNFSAEGRQHRDLAGHAVGELQDVGRRRLHQRRDSTRETRAGRGLAPGASTLGATVHVHRLLGDRSRRP